MADLKRRAVITAALQSLRGLFPYYKEKGVHAMDVVDWLHLTLNTEFSVKLKRIGVRFSCCYPLDRTACGIMLYSMGNAEKYLKYAKFAEMVYTVEGKLGASTSTFESSGEVTGEKVSGHVTRELLASACSSFEGIVKQIFPTGLPRKELVVTETFAADGPYGSDNWCFDDAKNHRMYIEGKPMKDVVCKRIEVVAFNPPQFRLKVVAEGGFSCRTLVNDLGLKMNTLAHLTGCRRDRLGPLSIEDGIEKHELYWPEVKRACDKYTPKYVEYCRPHLDRLPLYKERRFR